MIIVGDRSSSQALAEALGEGVNARIWSAPEADADPRAPAVGVLARALSALEADLQDQEFESVLLADDSEEALAAALVATKLLIGVLATDRARSGPGANARLIAELAEPYTAPA